jgi:hypothetical protein
MTTPPPAPPAPPASSEPPAAAAASSRRRIDPLAPVSLVVAAGIGITALHHPRVGMWVAAGGLAVAAVLRLVLRERNAGSLVVRIRRIDVVVLAGLAIALGVLATVTPFPSGTG